MTAEMGTTTEFETTLTGADRLARVFWDFDKADGITAQGVGESGSAQFIAPGTYTVTIMAEPAGGTAAPRSATMKVVVKQPKMQPGQGNMMMGPGGGMMGPGMMGPGGGMMGPGMMRPH